MLPICGHVIKSREDEIVQAVTPSVLASSPGNSLLGWARSRWPVSLAMHPDGTPAAFAACCWGYADRGARSHMIHVSERENGLLVDSRRLPQADSENAYPGCSDGLNRTWIGVGLAETERHRLHCEPDTGLSMSHFFTGRATACGIASLKRSLDSYRRPQ